MQKKSEVNIPVALLTLVKANIFAYIVTALFVIGTSLLLTYGNVKPGLESTILNVGIIFSAFVAGYQTATIENRNGYKWGAAGGALYYVIFLILGLVIEHSIAPTQLLILAVMILASSIIAGMISVNTHSYK